MTGARAVVPVLWPLLKRSLPPWGQGQILQSLDAWVQASLTENPVVAAQHLQTFKQQVSLLSQAAVSANRITLEVWDNRTALFHKSVACYLLALLLLMVSWLSVKARGGLARGAFGVLLLGAGCHFLGLLNRIIIMGRPPVSSLYESILSLVDGAATLLLIYIPLQGQKYIAPVKNRHFTGRLGHSHSHTVNGVGDGTCCTMTTAITTG